MCLYLTYKEDNIGFDYGLKWLVLIQLLNLEIKRVTILSCHYFNASGIKIINTLILYFLSTGMKIENI
jgi:hypothetical protein